MTLDDVYGSEHDRFPLEQERSPMACALDWNDVTGQAPRTASPPTRTAPDAALLLQAPRRAA